MEADIRFHIDPIIWYKCAIKRQERRGIIYGGPIMFENLLFGPGYSEIHSDPAENRWK